MTEFLLSALSCLPLVLTLSPLPNTPPPTHPNSQLHSSSFPPFQKEKATTTATTTITIPTKTTGICGPGANDLFYHNSTTVLELLDIIQNQFTLLHVYYNDSDQLTWNYFRHSRDSLWQFIWEVNNLYTCCRKRLHVFISTDLSSCTFNTITQQQFISKYIFGLSPFTLRSTFHTLPDSYLLFDLKFIHFFLRTFIWGVPLFAMLMLL